MFPSEAIISNPSTKLDEKCENQCVVQTVLLCSEAREFVKCSNDVYELFFCVVSNIFSTRMHSSADKIFENVYVCSHLVGQSKHMYVQHIKTQNLNEDEI